MFVYKEYKKRYNKNRKKFFWDFRHSKFSLKSLNTHKTRKNNKKKNLRHYLINSIGNFFDFSTNFNKRLLITIITLIIIGIIFTFSATISFSYWYSPNRNEYFFLLNHLRTLIIGIILIIPILFVKLEFIFKLWPIVYFTSFGLLCYLTYLSITGQIETIDGATRWINLGSLQFQPSEFIKLGLVVSLPPILKSLNKIAENKNVPLNTKLFWFILFSASFIIILILVLGTKNLGNAIIIGVIGIIGIWYISKYKIERLNLIALIILIVTGGLVFGIIESYRADRINVWLTYLKTGDTLYPNEQGELSREGKSYQLDQSLISIGTGGFSGKGLGNSIGKYYLPKTSAGDDSIFAVIAEELGFMFTIPIMGIYLYLLFQLLKMAEELKDNILYSCTLILISTWIGIQAFVHIGSNVGILPLTGQTLPFVSTGGSSIISLLISMALCLNISRYSLPKIHQSHSTSSL